MTSKNFESEFNDKNLCWLWDESLNPEFNVNLTLSVEECRYLANTFRKLEGRIQMEPEKFTEEKAEESML